MSVKQTCDWLLNTGNESKLLSRGARQILQDHSIPVEVLDG